MTRTDSADSAARNHQSSRRNVKSVLRIAPWLLFGLAVAGFMVLSFRQPLSADDFTNSLVLRSHPSVEAFVRYYYDAWTGRATGMAFLWFALRFHAAFAVLNGLAFGALAWLTVANGLGRVPGARGADAALLCIVVATYWYGMPAASETLVWATGSVTYLWSAVLMLAYLLPYRLDSSADDMPHGRRGPLGTVAAAVSMGLLGVLTGASHELVAVAVIVVLVAYFADALRQRRLGSVPAHLWTSVAGLAIGTAALFLSPGNQARSVTSGNHAGSIVGSVAQFGTYLAKTFGSYLPRMYPWLLLIVVLAIPVAVIAGSGRGSDSHRPYWAVWAIAGVATLAPFLVEPGVALLAGARTNAFIAVLFTVSAVSLLGKGVPILDSIPETWLNAATAIILGLVLVEIAGSIQVATAIGSQVDQREAYIAQNRDTGIADISVPPLAQKPYRTVYYVDLGPDPDYWLNRGLAKWYGVKSIRLRESASQ